MLVLGKRPFLSAGLERRLLWTVYLRPRGLARSVSDSLEIFQLFISGLVP